MDKLIEFIKIGLFLTEDEWIHPERNEKTFEIICVIDGIVCLKEEDREYQLEKGDLIILKPNVTHSGSKHSHGRTSFYWVHFLTDCFYQLKVSSYIRNFTGLAQFRKLLHVAYSEDYPDYAADSLLLSILADLSSMKTTSGNIVPKVVYEAAEWIRMNTSKALSVHNVASLYGYSDEHFSRLFKTAFHIGLKDFINTEKNRSAQNLLVNSSYSIKQIANSLGFDSLNNFVQFFKYHNHLSPSKYREQFPEIHMNNS